MPANHTAKGRLILVSGPSGAGKDAIIDGARRRLAGDAGMVFPLRTITRPEGFGGEIHVAVTPAQFDRLRRLGAFALCWGARGLNFAIPASIDAELASAATVVVNVSPAVLGEARERYPLASVVWVTASVQTCRRRLLLRGRENADEIERRLADAEEICIEEDVDLLVNEGSLDEAVGRLLAMLRQRMPLPLAGGHLPAPMALYSS
ncbi:MAG TPA: phosphonate metabolism protein/1,5-bisphosphokinase (PRPP-forming) PhnN [Rhodospirillaceae bacterium]|nr:phosphonate metabolism protein/1,5-bisphosphokinase (PRPP-forming) PhnN [Rhodospirillaceae bacterium]